MPPMPMGMPGADAFGAADGPRGTKRLRGEDSNTSLDVASAEGGQFSGDQNGMGMPGMPMDMPMPQFSGNPEQMMMMMQQSGMDPSQMPNMDPYNSAQGGAGFSGNNHSTSARGGRGRGRGRGSNPFGIGVNPSARGRPLSGAAGRGAGATNDPDYAQEAASGGGGSPLPGNVPTGPRGKGGPPPSGPRGGAAWRSHQDKDRDNSNTSRGYTGSELDYGGGSNGDGRSSRSRRRHDDDEYDDSYRRRRSSRSPGRRGRSRSPVYDDYA